MRVDAVVFDLLRDLGARAVRPERLEPFVGAGPAVRNRLQLVLVAGVAAGRSVVRRRPPGSRGGARVPRTRPVRSREVRRRQLFVSEGERTANSSVARWRPSGSGRQARQAGGRRPSGAVDSVERSRVLDASAAKMKARARLRRR
jgi:hypothetical protein